MNLARELDLVPVLDDLVAYGFAGLFEARRRFDPDRGVPFAGFASYRIRGAILDGVRQMGTLSRKTLLRVQRAANALCEQAGDRRYASADELLDALSETPTPANVVRTLGAHARATRPVEELAGELTEVEQTRTRR